MFLKFFHFFPIISQIIYYPSDVLKKASKEVFCLWFIATIPIFIGFIFDIITNKSFISSIKDTFDIKLLFIYTASYLSPFFLMIVEFHDKNNDKKSFRQFKGFLPLLLISILILCITAFTYRNDVVGNSFNITISLIIYFFAIYIWFLTTANKHYSIDYEEIFSSEEDGFLKLTRDS